MYLLTSHFCFHFSHFVQPKDTPIEASNHNSDIRSIRFKHTRIIRFFRAFLKIRPKIRRVVKVMQRTITGPQKLYAGFLENPEMPMQ